jgi:hypothetical protein
MTNFSKELANAVKGIKSLGLSPQIVGGVIERNSQQFITLAKQNVQDDTGNLARSIAFIDKNPKYRFSAVRLIGARVYGGFKGYHAYIYEHGTAERKTKTGASKGKMPASNYMRRAFDSYSATFIQNTERDIIRIIEDNAKKAGLNTTK